MGTNREGTGTAPDVGVFLRDVAAWAQSQPGIVAVALVGSYARGNHNPSSDIDLVLLADRPETYLSDTRWIHRFGEPLRQQTKNWGLVTSLRVWYADGKEVEFGLTSAEWGVDPSDEGTAQVIRDGLQVLYELGHVLSTRLRLLD